MFGKNYWFCLYIVISPIWLIKMSLNICHGCISVKWENWMELLQHHGAGGHGLRTTDNQRNVWPMLVRVQSLDCGDLDVRPVWHGNLYMRQIELLSDQTFIWLSNCEIYSNYIILVHWLWEAIFILQHLDQEAYPNDLQGFCFLQMMLSTVRKSINVLQK